MKKLITLVLTLALCVPMFMTTSVEVKAAGTCAHNSFEGVECEGTDLNQNGVCTSCVSALADEENENGWISVDDQHVFGKFCACKAIIVAEGSDYELHDMTYTYWDDVVHGYECSGCPSIGSEPHEYSDGSSICNKCYNGETPSEPTLVCWHDNCETILPTGSTKTVCDSCEKTMYAKSEKLDENSERPANQYHANNVYCGLCDDLVGTEYFEHYDFDVNEYCDYCNYHIGMGACIHECGKPAGYNTMCQECQASVKASEKFVKINEDGDHVVSYACKCTVTGTKYFSGHYNYDGKGYCICGEYVGFGSGDCGSGNKEENTASKAPTAEEIAEWTSAEVEASVKAEEAIPVTSFVSAEAVSTIPAEVKETSSTEAVYNLSKITTTQGFIAAVDKIVKANATTAANTGNAKAKAVTFYSEKPIAFNAASLTALSDAATEFVYMFKHEGHLYKVTIPAGAKVNLAGQRFAGPLYIGAQLGTSVLVK